MNSLCKVRSMPSVSLNGGEKPLSSNFALLNCVEEVNFLTRILLTGKFRLVIADRASAVHPSRTPTKAANVNQHPLIPQLKSNLGYQIVHC